ncbi:RNA-directed DNA polymerase, eukaryota [Tanacetum coccineum]|uniref:RNA-directed DNA polymerase, eukaryota n=1 Tax=Tanacetum coccineum TaxID=301880 RepID=A0ABQ4X075_9ASTR
MGFRFQNSLQSKIDQTSKISKSVFISNFPDDCSSRDLWKVCNGYGTVVDVFIPNKRSKAGKRFAFVRFINVLNLDRLIENLKTIWIGRFHLSANPARFERPKASTFQKEKPVPSGNVTGFKQPIVQNQGISQIVLWAKFSNFLPLITYSLNVGVASWFRRLCYAQSDFAAKERIVWVDIEGVPLNAWTRSTFQKISSKWGELVELEDGYDDLFARKRICIKHSQTEKHLGKFQAIGFEQQHGESNDKEVSSDPFNIYNLLDKRTKEILPEAESDRTSYRSAGVIREYWKRRKLRDIVSSEKHLFPRIEQSLNIQGLGSKAKKDWIKELISKHKLFLSYSAYLSGSHLSDQRTILLKESFFDFGPPPFRFYLLWLASVDSIDLVSKSWNSFTLDDSNGMIRLKKKLQMLKKEIRAWTLDFKRHQILELESPISNEDIRTAVWGCGVDKSPGPDGFTFEFFRKYWTVVGPDFCIVVKWFFDHGDFAIGCNSSFVALIPKVLDPKVVSDYRPISLIGSLYKVVTKILASRLSVVIGSQSQMFQTHSFPIDRFSMVLLLSMKSLARCKLKKQQAIILKSISPRLYDFC